MKFLIIDGNNLAYKVYAAFTASSGKGLTNSVGIPTTVIFGMLNSFQDFAKKHNVDKAIVCWDLGGGSAYRKGIFPLYKGNRVYKDMQEYFDELDTARMYLKSLNVPQAPLKGIEADDAIGYLSVQLVKRGHTVTVYSDDRDYYQLLRKGLQLYRPCKAAIYSLKDFSEDNPGIKPRYMYLIDAMCGQEKDFIPGACDIDVEKKKLVKFGFGPVKAIKALEAGEWKLSEVKRMLRTSSVLNEVHTEQLLKNWSQVLVSRKLSRIRIKPEEYSKKELEALHSVFDLAEEQVTVNSKKVIKLMRELEIGTINTIGVLKSIGIEVSGGGKTTVRKLKT